MNVNPWYRSPKEDNYYDIQDQNLDQFLVINYFFPKCQCYRKLNISYGKMTELFLTFVLT